MLPMGTHWAPHGHQCQGLMQNSVGTVRPPLSLFLRKITPIYACVLIDTVWEETVDTLQGKAGVEEKLPLNCTFFLGWIYIFKPPASITLVIKKQLVFINSPSAGGHAWLKNLPACTAWALGPERSEVTAAHTQWTSAFLGHSSRGGFADQTLGTWRAGLLEQMLPLLNSLEIGVSWSQKKFMMGE